MSTELTARAQLYGFTTTAVKLVAHLELRAGYYKASIEKRATGFYVLREVLYPTDRGLRGVYAIPRRGALAIALWGGAALGGEEAEDPCGPGTSRPSRWSHSHVQRLRVCGTYNYKQLAPSNQLPGAGSRLRRRVL